MYKVKNKDVNDVPLIFLLVTLKKFYLFFYGLKIVLKTDNKNNKFIF